jgi:hypothetical protein
MNILFALIDSNAFLLAQSTETYPIVIGYFDENSNADFESDKEAFTKAADVLGHSGFRFGYVTDKDVLEKSKYNKGCAVFVYKPVSFSLSSQHMTFYYGLWSMCVMVIILCRLSLLVTNMKRPGLAIPTNTSRNKH